MESSGAIDQIAAALVAAQSEMSHAVADKSNPHLKNNYADLGSVIDAVRPALNRHGIALVQTPEPGGEGWLICSTRLIHTTGQWLASTFAVPVQKADAQSYGSALTYARRYSLMAVCGIAPEDDDGNAASGTRPRPSGNAAPPQQRPAQPPAQAQAQQSRPAAPPAQERVNTTMRNNEQQTAGEMVATATTGLNCTETGCTAVLTRGQHDISTRAFGRGLCPAHQKEAARCSGQTR